MLPAITYTTLNFNINLSLEHCYCYYYLIQSKTTSMPFNQPEKFLTEEYIYLFLFYKNDKTLIITTAYNIYHYQIHNKTSSTGLLLQSISHNFHIEPNVKSQLMLIVKSIQVPVKHTKTFKINIIMKIHHNDRKHA